MREVKKHEVVREGGLSFFGGTRPGVFSLKSRLGRGAVQEIKIKPQGMGKIPRGWKWCSGTGSNRRHEDFQFYVQRIAKSKFCY